MYCPICGQQQVSEATRFCSRCGFVLSGVAEIIANGGAVPYAPLVRDEKRISPRRRGVRHGVFLMLLTLLIVPVLAILGDGINVLESLVALSAILLPVGGFLRIIYALMFESADQPLALNVAAESQPRAFSFKSAAAQNALPPQSANFNPVNSNYAPPASAPQTPLPNAGWREANTNELIMPPSVTEDTTKLLDKQNNR